MSLTAALACTWLAACSSPSLLDSEAVVGVPVRETCDGPEKAFVFGPAFDLENESQAKQASVYAKMLDAFKEQPLSCGSAFSEGYRILWPPSEVRPSGFAVQVVRANREFEIVAARVTINDRQFQMDRMSTRSLGREELAELTGALSALNASLHIVPSPRKQPPSVLQDGHAWLIEQRNSDRYHAAVLTLSSTPEFLNVSRAFVKLARLETPSELSR